MARSLRDIRRKMKAIKATRQVTKAMELVAASKMRKAVQHAQALRKYALHAWEILLSIGRAHASGHPFLVQRKVKRVLGIAFTSDRGLCGSLNAQLIRVLQQYIKRVSELQSFESMDFITVGRKGHQMLTRQNRAVIATFPSLSNHPTIKDVLPIARLAIDEFKKGTYDHLVLIYTDFISPILQQAAVKVLLPFSPSEVREVLGTLSESKRQTKEEAEIRHAKIGRGQEYLFEPTAKEVLDVILPQLTETQVFQAVLESVASEHSARMLAMHNATDSASEILDDITLTYNQTRQANITSELAELSAGAAALE
jgi:F-type H+-transporting ATPase subunit gamma